MVTENEHIPAADAEDEGVRHYQIQIDRVHYKVEQQVMTGALLRALPAAPIGSDRDLFEVVPGGTDRKIADTEAVTLRSGMRFFSAPAHINPGS